MPLALLCVLLLSHIGPTASAAGYEDYDPGTYEVSASLSCYVPAMGGVEFGAPLLTQAAVTVDEDGNAFMTLSFTKSSVTIYSITCDTFIDVSPSSPGSGRGVLDGTIGYYTTDGILQTDGVSYTLSSDTALNSASEEVPYVDSITFPLDRISDTYGLSMYINSNVMGVQFCNSNGAATESTYSSTLTVRWPVLETATGATNGAQQPAEGSSGESVAVQPEPDIPEPEGEAAPEGEAKTEASVSEDGLNVYYADTEQVIEDTEPPLSDYADAGVASYAALNMGTVKILGICAAVFIVAGAALIFTSRFTISKREAD